MYVLPRFCSAPVVYLIPKMRLDVEALAPAADHRYKLVYPGLAVPMPTLPEASMMKGVVSGEVLSSTTKEGPEPVLVTESLAQGVVEAMPTRPSELTRNLLLPPDCTSRSPSS